MIIALLSSSVFHSSCQERAPNERQHYTCYGCLLSAAAPQFQVVAGTLPPGLSLSAAGVLSGIPTRAGVYPDIQIQATGQGDPATERLTLTIAPAGAALVLTNATGQTVAPGSTVALRGQSFTPRARVALALDGRMLGSLLVANDGSFAATLFFAASAPERGYTLTATALAAPETIEIIPI